MKKQIYSAAFLVLPLAAAAQPTLNKVEDYTPGTSIKMLNAQAVAAGNAGANQTWNFAGLTPADTTTYTYMVASASSAFPTATLVEKSSDSIYRYFSKTAAATFVIGVADSSSSSDAAKVSYSNTLLSVQRPLSYNSTASDSFAHTITSGMYNITGKGEVTMKADGYGTLTLPTGTFSNVIRLRMEQNQEDSIGAPINMSFITKNVSYVWYDNSHKAPLLRIDSMDVAGGGDVNVTYLLKEEYPVSVKSINTKNLEFRGWFGEQELTLAGGFENGKAYTVNVYDLAGRTVYHDRFTATWAEKKVILPNPVPAGIYMISLLQNDVNAAGYIKVAKDY